jgi:hypothetical protein
MVDADRLVFVEERTGEELVLPLAQVVEILESLESHPGLRPRDTFGFHAGDQGDPTGPWINFFYIELPAVRAAVDYFVAASQTADYIRKIYDCDATTREPGESPEDFFKRAGAS